MGLDGLAGELSERKHNYVRLWSHVWVQQITNVTNVGGD